MEVKDIDRDSKSSTSEDVERQQEEIEVIRSIYEDLIVDESKSGELPIFFEIEVPVNVVEGEREDDSCSIPLLAPQKIRAKQKKTVGETCIPVEIDARRVPDTNSVGDRSNRKSEVVTLPPKKEETKKKRRKKRKKKRNICRLFDGTPNSCRFGETCRYLHRIPSSAPVKENAIAATATKKKLSPLLSPDAEEKNAANDEDVDNTTHATTTTSAAAAAAATVVAPTAMRSILRRLKYLPPIRMACSFPSDYPTKSPPRFVLSSAWHTKRELACLCRGLDRLWSEKVEDEGPGEIVFDWLEFLKERALSSSKRSSGIDLSHASLSSTKDGDVAATAENDDDRAQCEFDAREIENVLMYLIEYDVATRADAFNKRFVECAVCYEDVKGAQCVRLTPGCGHVFCLDCTREHVKVKVSEGDVLCIGCLNPKCPTPISDPVIKAIMDASTYARYERLSLQKCLDAMGDVVYCPKKKCRSPALEEPKDNFAQCPTCEFCFCTLCFSSFHPGTKCVSAAKRLEILENRMRGRRALNVEERARLKLMKEEQLTLKSIKDSAVRCPSCRIFVEKSKGCNKMICRCGLVFCFKCGKDITKKGYDHFKAQSAGLTGRFAPNACALFEDAEIEAFNAMMQRRYNEHHHFDAQFRERDRRHAQRRNIFRGQRESFRCPNCRNQNYRQQRCNRIACWACSRRFCASCRKVLRKGDNHYHPSQGCKEHAGAVE